ncbi:hypothetical protein [Clostridium beijerinckii]|uniref:Uncharacterized protein n=1 Tax=Clostridium beijerinckii TaxID=1520 RepID=A0AAE5H099_CLOBE|nr:hypothetical protein [Clostridium beijerinckii]NSB12156.1 hypothetical protein [Clostridium beijerinckii]
MINFKSINLMMFISKYGQGTVILSLCSKRSIIMLSTIKKIIQK